MSAKMTRALAWLVILALVAVAGLAVACGGDDDDDDGGAATTAPAEATAPAEGPGTVTLTSTAIQGQSDRVLLVFASPASGGGQVARICVPIASDDFTLPETVMTDVPAGDNPCEGGTEETTFDEGTYTITAGVYIGGQQTPETETTATVDVAGDVTLELDGSELSE
jgi:hypothetical protein